MTQVHTQVEEQQALRSLAEQETWSRRQVPLSTVVDRVQSMAELCDATAAWIADELQAEFLSLRIQCGRQRCESSNGDPQWMPLAQGLSICMDDDRQPLVRLLDETDGRRCAAIMIPQHGRGVDSGSLVAVVECPSLTAVQDVLKRLESVSQEVRQAISEFQSGAQSHSATSIRLRTLAKSVSYSSVDEFCYAIANGLRVEADADLVAVGLVNGYSVRLSCVSGLDETAVDSPGSRLIRGSMEEALDAGRPVCVQSSDVQDPEFPSDDSPLTVRWQHQAGGAAVMSLPLMNAAGCCVAVVSVQGRHGQVFSNEQLQAIENLTSPLVAAMELMKSGQRSLMRHALDAADDLAARICGPLKLRVLVTSLAVAAISAWMVLGTTEHIVRTPCTIIAASTHVLSAPWEGSLKSVRVRSGETVHEGQLLACMDTRHLLAEAGLAQLDLQLANAEIRAPYAGQIVSDDLTDRTGEIVPVGEPLFEVVPHGALALELQLPETSLSYVESGQTGSCLMNARPDAAQECRLERIDPVAEAEASGNVVPARACLQGSPGWLRPGMQGVVRINAGERPVWWVWLHKVVDAANYRIWSLTGKRSESVAEHDLPDQSIL